MNKKNLFIVIIALVFVVVSIYLLQSNKSPSSVDYALPAVDVSAVRASIKLAPPKSVAGVDEVWKTVEVGSISVITLVAEATVEGDPVVLKTVSVEFVPVKGSKLHENTIRRVLLKRDDAAVYAESSDPSCNAYSCRYTLNTEGLFAAKPLKQGEPLLLSILLDIFTPGKAELGDYFQARLLPSGFSAVTATGGEVMFTEINGLGSRNFITPQSVVIQPSWPLDSTVAVPVEKTVVGTFIVENKGKNPIRLSSLKFVDEGSVKSGVRYHLYASASGSNPNDISVKYAVNQKSPFFNDLRSENPADLQIEPESYRYLSVLVSGDFVSGDTFKLKIQNFGDVTYSVSEKELGYSANPSKDQDTRDTIQRLFIVGTPILGEVSIVK